MCHVTKTIKINNHKQKLKACTLIKRLLLAANYNTMISQPLPRVFSFHNMAKAGKENQYGFQCCRPPPDWKTLGQSWVVANCTSPIMHLVCVSIAFSFSWKSCNSVFSLTWPASMQIYWNKRKLFYKKRVQLPQDWFGTPTWPVFHCLGTQIWPP